MGADADAEAAVPGDPDTGGFAWEATAVRPARRPSPRWRRVGACIRGGAIAGGVPAAILFAVYVVRAWEWGMPWLRIASVLAVYAPISGILLAACVELLVVVTDRVGRAWWPLRVVANPVIAGLVGGGVAGIAPGAFGVPVFGSYTGPFVGTAPLACACLAAAALVVVPIARRSGVARRRLAAAMVAATLVVVVLAAVIAPVVVDEAFVQVNEALAAQGPVIGATCGVIGGAILGFYVGLVILLGRARGDERARGENAGATARHL